MKKWILLTGMLFSFHTLCANGEVKKAFVEGIKVSMEVVKYEKSQAFKDVPSGYCVTVIGKDAPLDMWEEVKLESLALFLELSPSLLASNKSDEQQRVLCLSIDTEKIDAVNALKKISKHYPKIDKYITKVEILPAQTMHRIIPGIGEYFKDRSNEVEVLQQKATPLGKKVNGRIVFLSKNEKSKTLFDSGSTHVLGTVLKNVLYVEHTVYRKKSK